MLVGTAIALAALAPAAPAATVTVGHSVQGRPITALRVGDPRAKRRILVVGEIHGNELAGLAVTRRLRRAHPPRGVQLWLIDELNPDGAAAGTRQNAHGVDLNRNFPYRWKAMGGPSSTYYSGPRPLSEPESTAAAAFIKRIKPRVTIWYHQHLRLVTRTGRLSARGVRRHSGAALAVAGAIAPPRIKQRRIPFGEKRKREMAAYAKRHYGIDDWRLRHPHVIVEHYTDNDSFGATYNTFAPDRPDSELGELPGVCSHFVIDRNGAIYQLVSIKIMCRHTVGLNWTAIGIEHVGRSDGQVMGDRRQLRSSLRLTRFLQGLFGIALRNVIGHNESLSSPYHHERVARLRHQTHGDMRHATMNRYRRLLSRLPAPASVR